MASAPQLYVLNRAGRLAIVPGSEKISREEADQAIQSSLEETDPHSPSESRVTRRRAVSGKPSRPMTANEWALGMGYGEDVESVAEEH
jgi:hypothetical protein